MSKKLQLTIPKPCHENWDTMTPVQQGKFCGSCQKQVVDFSNMSDRQVAQFFKKPSTGSVCGRFMTDQLDRNIEIPRKRIPWVKYFFQFAIPAFLVSIRASAGKTQGQIRVKTVTTDTTKRPLEMKLGKVARPTCTKPLMGDTIITSVRNPVEFLKGEISNNVIDERNRTITGKAVDEKGDALPGASIRIKGTSTGVAADNNGAFYLHAKKGDVLQVLGAGLELTEVPITGDRNIIITVKRMVLGGISIIRYKTKNELKNVPLMPAATDDKNTAAFKVFPNPVESGGNLNIEWKQTEEGYYTLQLLNQSGQSVHQQEIWIDAEARLLNIDVPPVAAGAYFLTLINMKSGRKYTEKILIQ